MYLKIIIKEALERKAYHHPKAPTAFLVVYVSPFLSAQPTKPNGSEKWRHFEEIRITFGA